MEEIAVDAHSLRPDRLQAVQEWVRSFGVEPNDVRPLFTIRRGEREWELHLSRFRRGEGGRMIIDHARNDVVTDLMIVHIGARESWPSFEGGVIE